MSRKGHYLGGGASVGSRDTSWWEEGSTWVPPAESGPRPPLSPLEQAQYEAFKQNREQKSRLIKAEEMRAGRPKYSRQKRTTKPGASHREPARRG
jgi:hypothetical protein